MTKNRLVWVEWLDSCNPHPRWEWTGDVEPDFVSCVSVGFIILEDKEMVTIAPTIAVNQDQVNGAHTIPRCAITKIRKMK